MFHYSTDDWVYFKTFIAPALMVGFIVLQMFYLYQYIPDPSELGKTETKTEE
jgi:intracellular septation protein